MSEYQALISALEWHIDADIAEMIEETPQDKTKVSPSSPVMFARDDTSMAQLAPLPNEMEPPVLSSSLSSSPASPPLGAAAAKLEAEKLAQDAKDLNALRAAIEGFDGLAIKKTATNMVFGDGNPNAHIMIVGEAPGADEDRHGMPFMGVNGQLLDRILEAIGLSRKEDEPMRSVYLSNVLNWRPPGNRTPNPAEIEVSLPFIKRHIELVAPKILVFAGGVSAKAILNQSLSLSKLRSGWHEFEENIPAMVTYHPVFLLHNPAQKKAVWMDMIKLMKKREELRIV